MKSQAVLRRAFAILGVAALVLVLGYLAIPSANEFSLAHLTDSTSQDSSIIPPPSKKIPSIIHQKYWSSTVEKWAEEEGENNRTDWFLSWPKKNPGSTHLVLDDESGEEFMKKHFDGPIYDAFKKLPLKVLKADMLRYATLYIHGGIYSDSDTECLHGLDTWIGNYTDAEFVVGIEWYKNHHKIKHPKYRKLQLVQWTFAAIPAHPVFMNAMTRIVQTVDDSTPEYLGNKDNVEEIGGPSVFTNFVQQWLIAHGETFYNVTKANFEEGDKRVYFEKSRVLLLPMYSFYSQFGGTKDIKFVKHYFKGWSSKKIPAVIHQSYWTSTVEKWAEEEGESNRTDWFLSWPRMNPGATHLVLDDASGELFMKKHFAGPIYDAFKKLPLKVLKADMLRYAAVYMQGGIYSDSDTECLHGLDTWIGNYTDAELIVGIEWYKDHHDIDHPKYRKLQLVQWTFAAVPRHPVFMNAIARIVQTVEDSTPEFLGNKDNVEEIGGPS
ncbi:membrane-bound alpha-1,6- mannosyltransferase Initiation-specific, partial [Chytriomyces hyalinus]